MGERNPASSDSTQLAMMLRRGLNMAGVLLALFPLLLMVHTRAAWVALGTAIAILCSKRLGATRHVSQRPLDNDVSI